MGRRFHGFGVGGWGQPRGVRPGRWHAIGLTRTAGAHPEGLQRCVCWRGPSSRCCRSISFSSRPGQRQGGDEAGGGGMWAAGHRGGIPGRRGEQAASDLHASDAHGVHRCFQHPGAWGRGPLRELPGRVECGHRGHACRWGECLQGSPCPLPPLQKHVTGVVNTRGSGGLGRGQMQLGLDGGGGGGEDAANEGAGQQHGVRGPEDGRTSGGGPGRGGGAGGGGRGGGRAARLWAPGGGRVS